MFLYLDVTATAKFFDKEEENVITRQINLFTSVQIEDKKQLRVFISNCIMKKLTMPSDVLKIISHMLGVNIKRIKYSEEEELELNTRKDLENYDKHEVGCNIKILIKYRFTEDIRECEKVLITVEGEDKNHKMVIKRKEVGMGIGVRNMLAPISYIKDISSINFRREENSSSSFEEDEEESPKDEKRKKTKKKKKNQESEEEEEELEEEELPDIVKFFRKANISRKL